MTEYKTETQKGIMAQAQHYGHIIFKWKWTILVFFFVVITSVTLYVFLTKPTYMASSSIWIDDEPKILPFEEIQTLSANSNLPSQTQLLQSRALAAEIIEKLKLHENPEFSGKKSAGGGSFQTAPLQVRERLIEDFLKSISVTPITGTRMVEVRFTSRHPQLAADALNALVEGFIAMIIKKSYRDSEQAMEFLSNQIVTLRNEIGEREKQLNSYGSEKSILPPTASEAPTVTRLAEFNKTLTDATIDRINKYNYYNQIKSAPLGEIPDAPAGTLIQTLRGQYSTLSREYAKRLATIRPEYPEMQRLKSELDAATEALQNETQNLIRVALTNYQAALRKEQSFQKQLDDLKNEVFKSNSNSIQYNSLQIELASKKTLLETLSKKQSETDVSSQLKGLKAINVWVVDKADPPLNPAFPNKRKILMIAVLFGLAGGLGLGLALESMSQTVNTSKDIAKATDLPTLGVIPSFGAGSKGKGSRTEWSRIVALLRGGGTKMKKEKSGPPAGNRSVGLDDLSASGETPKNMPAKIELIASREPNSIQAEGFRSIRTMLFISTPPRKSNTILFTSALAREGKSSSVSNLALVMAKGGKKVVIIDADLRKPKQHKIFRSDNNLGMTNFLSSHIDFWQVVQATSFPNLCLIKCGPIPANPIELLTSERMEELLTSLKPNFDFILIDSPPILAVSDSLAMGPLADGAILVARGGQTPIPALKQAKEKLDAHKIKCLGVILNDVDLIEEDGYYAREYYHYAAPD